MYISPWLLWSSISCLRNGLVPLQNARTLRGSSRTVDSPCSSQWDQTQELRCFPAFFPLWNTIRTDVPVSDGSLQDGGWRRLRALSVSQLTASQLARTHDSPVRLTPSLHRQLIARLGLPVLTIFPVAPPPLASSFCSSEAEKQVVLHLAELTETEPKGCTQRSLFWRPSVWRSFGKLSSAVQAE